MPHFPINSNDVQNGAIKVLQPDIVHHITASLRARTGETLKFIDENGIQYYAEITGVSKKEVAAKVLKSEKSLRSLGYKLYLAQSILKNEAQNLLVANASELGIKGVYPFISEYSAVKGSVAKLKADKWQKSAFEAFKQCERADVMPVYGILELPEILKKFKMENVIIFAERDADFSVFEAVKTLDSDAEILVVTGPEGGFSNNELDFFKKNGCKTVTLGNLILRAPNAVTAGVSRVIEALDIKMKEGV